MDLIVSSVCPNIIGHEFVKLGLALALFGTNIIKGAMSKHCVIVCDDVHMRLL